jgi:hypothetical protein
MTSPVEGQSGGGKTKEAKRESISWKQITAKEWGKDAIGN